MNQEVSKAKLDSQMYYEQKSNISSSETEYTEVFTPSEYDNTIVILHTLLDLIKRPQPIYTFQIVKNGYKCYGKLEGITKASVALNKREAKHGVTCLFINMLINDEKYGTVIKEILRKNYNIQCTSSEPEQDIEEKKDENNTFLKKKRERSESEENENKNEKCNHQSLLFELFLLKWELNHSLDDSTIISINSFKNSVTLMILKYKLNNSTEIEFYQLGSMQSKTLRNDNIQLDFYILVKQCNDSMYNEFIDCVYNEANNNNYSIDFLPNEKYIQITSKPQSATIRILDHNQSKIFSNHASFLSNQTMTQENSILIKILKSWRRCYSLFFLPPEVIEYLILNQHEEQPFFDNNAIVERIIFFFKTIKEIEKKKKETWGHLFSLLSELLSSNSNLFTVTQAGERALENIKLNKFDKLF